jgi:hypothetical protein
MNLDCKKIYSNQFHNSMALLRGELNKIGKSETSAQTKAANLNIKRKSQIQYSIFSNIIK